MRSIQAVLFDLGDTLIRARDPWPPVFERAAGALTRVLMRAGLPLDDAGFPALFNKRLNEYYASREADLYEKTTAEVLRALLRERGMGEVPDALVRTALDALYQVTQANWVADEEAVPTVQTLQRSGYRLGIVSNAGDDKDVHELVERAGIDGFFDFILTSAACSYRKPHPRIFELALAHWQLAPGSAAMVGDRLEADVLGAQRAGLTGIWIRRRIDETPDRTAPGPDAVIERLSQLPGLLHDNTF